MMVQITSEELRRLKAAKAMLDPADERHGTRYGYKLGCRCDRCRIADKRYKVSYAKGAK